MLVKGHFMSHRFLPFFKQLYRTITYVNEEIRFPSITEEIEINANVPDVITLSDCTLIAV